jgi:hypothetical protein
MATTSNDVDIRTAHLVDLPVLRRLTEHALVLDSELGCTRDTLGVHGALIGGGMWTRDHYTLIGRVNRQNIAGQIRVKPQDHLAQIVFIAPQHDDGDSNTGLLHMLDAMVTEAGRRGAHMLTAEIDEHSPMFTTFRSCGFAVYARQELWRGTLPFPAHIQPAALTRESTDDTFDIQLLYSNIVPRLVQPIAVPSSESEGLVYRQDGRVRGYIAFSEGKHGVYVTPYLHPDIPYQHAASILAGAIVKAERAEKAPITICVRRYQDWLETALREIGFDVVGQGAVMVKHIAAGVRHSAYATLTQVLEAMPAAPQPAAPTHRISRIIRIRPKHSGDFVKPLWNIV